MLVYVTTQNFTSYRYASSLAGQITVLVFCCTNILTVDYILSYFALQLFLE